MVTTIRLPDELHRKLKAEAEKRGMTLNGYLISVLWEAETAAGDIYAAGEKEVV